MSHSLSDLSLCQIFHLPEPVSSPKKEKEKVPLHFCSQSTSLISHMAGWNTQHDAVTLCSCMQILLFFLSPFVTS